MLLFEPYKGMQKKEYPGPYHPIEFVPAWLMSR
jgi:hypothetical protein